MQGERGEIADEDLLSSPKYVYALTPFLLIVLLTASLNNSSDCAQITTSSKKVTSITYTTPDSTLHSIPSPKGVVLALGNTGLSSVVRSSPSLSSLPTFARAMNLKSIDVISVRLWFDKIVHTRTPANVFSRFPSLRGSGGTFFMLDQLQGNTRELWGEDGEAIWRHLKTTSVEVTRLTIITATSFTAAAAACLLHN